MNSLEVTGVRFFQKEDGVKHHTDKFQVRDGTSVFRRGEVFHLVITFEAPFDPELHRILLELHTGRESRRLETTSDLLRVSEPTDPQQWPPEAAIWGARRTPIKRESAAAVSVCSPAWLPIGRWTLEVRTELLHQRRFHSSIFTHPADIYFLFNPWNPEDETYLENKNLLQEYVLNDIGHVWTGADNGPMTIWDYGQFEDVVLPAFEMAMNQDGFLRRHRRGDPVEVSRAISRLVSFTGRSGILVGRWTQDPASYADGEIPTHWTGSHEILELFLRSGGRPVKYAQCWVFAGLATTAIGLPCRLVTNLSSGHDSDQSLTVDIYYDQNLEEDDDSETIWNFHVWVDVWMRRQDLRQPEYDGWQTIDGTPQERSQGRYQCGPCPVQAVRAGDTQAPYDAHFVFAEVNGDRARWARTERGLRLIDVHEKMIGEAILTDDPDSKEPRAKDITAEYKSPEGSAPERMAIWRAASNPYLALASRRRRELDAHRFLNDVAFESESPAGIHFGDRLPITLRATNTSEEERTVEAEVLMEVVDHAGRAQRLFSSTRFHMLLPPHQSERVSLQAEVGQYAPGLRESMFLRQRVKCRVAETRQPWLSDARAIEVYVPGLDIHFEDELWVGRPVYAFLSLDRAIAYPLTGCRLRLGGSGLERGGGVIFLNDLPSGERLRLRIRIHPVRSGIQKITGKFTSNEIPKAEGWVEVEVRARGGGPGGASRGLLNFDDHMDEILDNAV